MKNYPKRKPFGSSRKLTLVEEGALLTLLIFKVMEIQMVLKEMEKTLKINITIS